MIKLFRITLHTLLFLALGAAAHAAPPPPVIRIGIANPPMGNPPHMSSSSTLAVTHAQGLLEREFRQDKTRVEWIFFKGTGPAVNEALTTGQLDFALQGDLPALIGRSSGLKTRVLLPTSSRTNAYLAVPVGSTIRSVADLKGKRVALSKGTMTQLPVNRILAAHGLSEKDLRLVNLDSASLQAALVSKDIDAAFSGAVLLNLRDRGQAKIVYSTKAAPQFTGQSLMLVTDAFAARYPDTVQRVVNTVVKAARWASEDSRREEVFGIWALGGTKASVWREEFDGYPLAVRVTPVTDAFVRGRLQQAADDALRYRLIRKPVDVDTWIDRRFVDAALKSQKLEGYFPAYDPGGKQLAKR